MAGATISVEVDSQAVVDMLRALAERGENLRPVWLDIGEMLLNRHRERWKEQVGPDGTPWAPLSEEYARRKPRNKGKILVLDDFLRGQLGYQVEDDELALGTNRIYGATHQFGRGPIPAREFLGLDDADHQAIVELLGDYLSPA